MQDERGNWREVDRIREGMAIAANGDAIGDVSTRPMIRISEPVTVRLKDGTEIAGRVTDFKGASLTIHTSPATRPNRDAKEFPNEADLTMK